MLRNNERNLEPENTARVRRFRTEANASERIMWEILRGGRLGYRFRRQHPVGPYALDFFCPEAMLCVEIDGEIHKEHTARDAARDAFLLERQILTYRLPTLVLFEGASTIQDGHIAEIVRLCKERAPSPCP